MIDLRGTVAIITGAAGALGRAYSLALAQAGAAVVPVDIDGKGAEETAALVADDGGTALARRVDVTDPEATRTLAAATRERFGRIDVLVNNAALYGTLQPKPFEEVTPAEWDDVMAVNLKGLFLCCQAVVPTMKAQGSGSIINVASGTVFIGVRNRIHYTTSKMGVIGFTRALAREVGPHGIRVNTLAPGLTDTPASRAVNDAAMFERVNQARALGRTEVPQDLVGAVLYLACPLSAFVTGQVLNVDGGMSMH